MGGGYNTFAEINFAGGGGPCPLTKSQNAGILKTPCSRGSSGLLYLQSAIAGVMARRGLSFGLLPFISGDEVWVLRNGCL